MSEKGKHLYEFGEFQLNAAERLLLRDGITIPLPPKAIDLLSALVEQPGRVLDKQTLLKLVWADTFVEEGNLADNIFKLRRVLGEGDEGPKFIETVPKRGYRFIAEVRVANGASESERDQPEGEPEQQSQQAGTNMEQGRRLTTPVVSVSSFFAGAIVLLALTQTFGYLHRGPQSQSEQVLKASLLPPGDASFGDIAVSSDGKWLAFTAATGSKVQLWLRSLINEESNPVQGTEGASYPFWSPDGGYIGFFANGKLKKVQVGGGWPTTLCPASAGTGGTWNRDGVILFTVLGVSEILRVSASGGVPDMVLRADAGQTDLHEPYFLPDGRHFLYLALSSGNTEVGGIYASSLDGGVRKRVLRHDSNVAYVPGRRSSDPGYLLFGREGGLSVQQFDSNPCASSVKRFPSLPGWAPDKVRISATVAATLPRRRADC